SWRRTRKDDRKPRAAADAAAVGGNGAAVQFDQVLDNGQAKPEAGRGIRLILAERLEYVGQELRMNPDSGITDNHNRARLITCDRYSDVATGGRELQGVRQEIHEDLPETGRVAENSAGLRRQVDRQGDVFLLEFELYRSDAVAHDLV